MNYLKVVHGGKLGDDEAMSSSNLGNPTSLKNTLGKSEVMDGDEFGPPQLESVIEKEVPHE